MLKLSLSPLRYHQENISRDEMTAAYLEMGFPKKRNIGGPSGGTWTNWAEAEYSIMKFFGPIVGGFGRHNPVLVRERVRLPDESALARHRVSRDKD